MNIEAINKAIQKLQDIQTKDKETVYELAYVAGVLIGVRSHIEAQEKEITR